MHLGRKRTQHRSIPWSGDEENWGQQSRALGIYSPISAFFILEAGDTQEDPGQDQHQPSVKDGGKHCSRLGGFFFPKEMLIPAPQNDKLAFFNIFFLQFSYEDQLNRKKTDSGQFDCMLSLQLSPAFPSSSSSCFAEYLVLLPTVCL